jgi:hypothetical protein
MKGSAEILGLAHSFGTGKTLTSGCQFQKSIRVAQEDARANQRPALNRAVTSGADSAQLDNHEIPTTPSWPFHPTYTFT